MKMMEHNPEKAKKGNISPEQAKEYTSHNVGKMEFSRLKEKIKRKK